MKKIITLIFAITVLMLVSIGIQAQPQRKSTNIKYPTKTQTNNRNNNRTNYRGVQTHYTTEYVWKRGKKYENTYKVTVQRNGRKNKLLIRSVQVKRNYRAKIYYQNQTVRQGRNFYRMTYKITQFPRGRTSKVLIKKVLINNKKVVKKSKKNW